MNTDTRKALQYIIENRKAYDEALDMKNGLGLRAEAELAAKDEALTAAQTTVSAYATAARAIALWTDKYCNKDLSYDEMIAQAVRDMAKDLESKNAVIKAAQEFIDCDGRDNPPAKYRALKDALAKAYRSKAIKALTK